MVRIRYQGVTDIIFEIKTFLVPGDVFFQSKMCCYGVCDFILIFTLSLKVPVYVSQETKC